MPPLHHPSARSACWGPRYGALDVFLTVTHLFPRWAKLWRAARSQRETSLCRAYSAHGIWFRLPTSSPPQEANGELSSPPDENRARRGPRVSWGLRIQVRRTLRGFTLEVAFGTFPELVAMIVKKFFVLGAVFKMGRAYTTQGTRRG